KWKNDIRLKWPQLKVLDYHVVPVEGSKDAFFVGEQIEVIARVHLGDVQPDNVCIQAYYGPVENSQIHSASKTNLTSSKPLDNGDYEYRGLIPASDSGAYGLNIRILPHHAHLTQDHELRLITWAR
ncbi:MAG: hypothetical protein ABI615_13960, partial [Chthoniobacterales bacterium]